MRTAAMNRELPEKTEAFRDLTALRQRLIELAEIDRKILTARQRLIEHAEVDRKILTGQEFLELDQIDRKILAAITSNGCTTQIEIDSGKVTPPNRAVMMGLGYHVERLPFQKTTISWKLAGPETTSK